MAWGATVTVTLVDSSGKAAAGGPLSYVSPTQINFVVPDGLANGSGTVTVTNSGGSSAFATTIATVSPSLFTADSSGTGVPAAFALTYAGGSTTVKSALVFKCSGAPLVCTANPIALGPSSTSVYLELFGTGIRGRGGLASVSVTLGGVALEVTYAGAQGGYAGLDQVNALVARSLAGQGAVTLQLTVDDAPAELR